MADITGCDTVVSSDKGPHHYERFGLPDICFVPYKDMRAYVASYIVNWERRNKSIWDKSGTLMEDVNPTDDEVARGIPWVVDNYTWCLDWAHRMGLPAVAVPLEELALHPFRAFRTTCEALYLPVDFSALDFCDRPHHHIGGNFSVAVHHGDDYAIGTHRTYAHQWQEKFKRRIVVDDKWKKVLSPEQAKHIENDSRVASLVTRFEEVSTC
jgi:hypothetical protein